MTTYLNHSLKNNPSLKQSFFRLANETFQIDLQAWEALGYWDDSYNVHCIEHNNEIIANVSTSEATLVLDHQLYRTKQIGTVMTARRYRQLGYAKSLMQHVLQENANADFIFLFANKQTASFYQQFGFELVMQRKFTIQTNNISFKQTDIKKLDFKDEKTRLFIVDLLTHRLPVSSKLGVLRNEMIILFHIMTSWSEHLYYIPALKTMVIGKQEKGRFILADFISKQPVLLKELLPFLNVSGDVIELGFTPSSLQKVESFEVIYDYFYVKNQCDIAFPSGYYFPDLGKA